MDITRDGIEATVPPGWDVRFAGTPRTGLSAAQEESEPSPFLHAATFQLPSTRGTFGGGAIDVMGSNDVFIALVDCGIKAAGTALFTAKGPSWPIEPDHFVPGTTFHRLPGRAGVQRAFTAEGRAMCLFAVIGDYKNRSSLAPIVNQFLAGLKIHPLGNAGSGPPPTIGRTKPTSGAPSSATPGSTTTRPSPSTTASNNTSTARP